MLRTRLGGIQTQLMAFEAAIIEAEQILRRKGRPLRSRGHWLKVLKEAVERIQTRVLIAGVRPKFVVRRRSADFEAQNQDLRALGRDPNIVRRCGIADDGNYNLPGVEVCGEQSAVTRGAWRECASGV